MTEDRYEAILDMWRGFGITDAAGLDLALDSFRILFAYHSGKIENPEITYHDTREIFENGRVVGFSGDPRSIMEQQNQRLCYSFLLTRLPAGGPLTTELVRETHGILTGGTYDERRYVARGERPGAFKKHDYVTGRNEVGSAPEAVEQDLTELLEEINAYDGPEILKAGAYFHLAFESIHPFADGNGRVGRTLLNYFLISHDHPPVIVYEEDKAEYYAALEAYDTAEDLAPMANFLKKETVKTWEKRMARQEGN